MTRVLAYTSPARGHLYPLTPILAELRDRGHEVVLRTMASQVPLMRELGFDAAPIDPQIETIKHDDWQTSSQPAALGRSVATFLARARSDGPDLRTAIAETDPDIVIVDINSWGAVAAAEAWGGRWASFCPYPLPVSSRHAPPFGPGFAPARGPLGRLRDRLARPVVLGTVERTMMPKVNAVRREHGLEALRNADALYGRPPLLLYLTAEPFEYPRSDWPENVVMVGPCDWDPDVAAPAWLDEIASPIVLVTTSSEFQGDARLVQAALDALRDEPMFVVATLPAIQVLSACQPTPVSSSSSRIALSLIGPPLRSPTAGWAPRRRRWRAACRSAPYPSDATNSRWRAGSRSRGRGRGCRRNG
jgi:UDP:flavonoid glycosyltransferase YjiC (YdhE family)